MPRTKKLDLESSLESLEDLVDRMENGGLSLEDSLKEFEQGIKLVQSCQKSLSDAEQKVEILLKKSSSARPVDFE
ncbi:MAG: exodeoxyribonuclease VII small subunit [Cycloclasticus sp.]|mgnify:CR=1 FL=1|nr:exodeoxyribonuclease VII small subunit [Cycloclasticus sp. 46_83_sub15_T18]OUR82851.1 exodeoxyribonuclease VII small subunit [Cycloclasticus sp. 46_120_T64]